jgi:hypothetical protein
LRGKATPSERMGLLLRQAFDARVSMSPEFEGAVQSVVQIARQHRAGAFMVLAGRLLSFHTGFPPVRRARAVLEEALSLLGADDDELRAITLAHLATVAPLAYDAHASHAQVARAAALTERSGSVHARFGVLTAQLYLAGGPTDDGASGEAERAFETFSRQGASPFAAVMLDVHRAIVALQRGDRARAELALSGAELRCRALGSRELLWHVERFQAHVQADGCDEATTRESLRALHRRARDHNIVATALFVAYDEVLVLGDAPSQTEVQRVCMPDTGDPPSVWSMKVRLLAAAGQHDAAWSALSEVPPERLAALPHDRDYLGTLGALTRASLELHADTYLKALLPLLASQMDKFAVHVAFHDEGAVAGLCAEIATALGHDLVSAPREPIRAE